MSARDTTRPPGGATGGFTIVEIAVASLLLAMLTVTGMSVLGQGTEAYKQEVGEERALEIAGSAVQSIVRELKDATGDSIVFDPSAPGAITFQRMTGYDPGFTATHGLGNGGRGGKDNGYGLAKKNRPAECLISTPITIGLVPLSVPGASGLSAIERTQSGAPTSRLGSYVTTTDPGAPTLPGLQFSVSRSGRITTIGIVVTVRVPCGKSGSFDVKRATSVALEVE